MTVTHDDYAMESGFDLPVPTGPAVRCENRAGAAEFGEGSFGADPLRFLADEDEHLRRDCGRLP